MTQQPSPQSSHAPLARYAVLISGSGTNLQALIDAAERGEIDGEINVVISNRADAKGLERANRHGIAHEVLDHKAFADREHYDAALMATIDRRHVDLVVLAGFMRILTPGFVEHYAGRMLNIHPSLLPAYKGLHTHERVLEAGDKEHGCSVHFVTPELDGGPIIAQGKVPVFADDTPATLGARVQQMEYPLYVRCVSLFMAGRLAMDAASGLVQLDGRPLKSGELDLAWSPA